MAKKMLIDATHAEETRVVVVDGNKVEEFDFESENKRQLAGNIYLAKVTRVEPSLQAAFVDYGGNRHGFLAFSEIHPDYYQIPVADREALLAEEQAYAEAMAAEDEKPKARRSRSRRSRSKSRAEESKSNDAVATKELDAAPPAGMDVIDLDEGGADPAEGHSPMDLVEETPPVADPDEVKAETSVDTASDAAAEAAAETDAPAAPPKGGMRRPRPRHLPKPRKRMTRRAKARPTRKPRLPVRPARMRPATTKMTTRTTNPPSTPPKRTTRLNRSPKKMWPRKFVPAASRARRSTRSRK